MAESLAGLKGGGFAGKSPPVKPPPRPTGPGYGVLRPGVRSAPAPRPAPAYKPPPRLFTSFAPPARTFQHAAAQATGRREHAELQQPGVRAAVQHYRAEQPRYRAQLERGNQRLGLPRGFRGALPQQAHPQTSRERALATLGPSEFGGGEFDLGKALRNIPGSAIRLVTGIPGAVYQGGKAVGELAQGKPQGAEQIVKGLKEVALHPGKFATEEPVSAGLMLAGGESAASRLLGVSREARAPLSLYGDIAKERTLPASLTRRAGSALADKFRESILKADPNQAIGWRLNRELKGGTFKPGQVDVQHGMGEAMTKLAVAHHEDFLRRIKPSDHPSGTSLYYEGYIRRPETAVEDAEKRLAQLEREHDRLPRGQQRLNESQQQNVQQFLAMPTKARKELEGTARIVAREHQPLVHEMVNVGHLEPNQPHAALVPFALEHGELLGRGPLHYEQNPGIHPLMTDLKAAIKAHEKARATVKTLSDEIKGARYAKGFKSGKHFKLDVAKSKLTDAYAQRTKAERDVRDAELGGLMKRGTLIRTSPGNIYRRQPSGEMYPHIQDASGRPVTTQEILDLWNRETNHRPVGFISHKDEAIVAKGGRGFGGGRPGSMVRSRTGEKALSGAYDNSWNAIRRNFRTANRNITGHLNENQLMARFGVGGKDGLFTDKADAEALAKHYTDHNVGGTKRTPIQWVVRSVGPDKIVSRADMQHVDGMKILEQFGAAEHKAIEDVNPYGKWAVMPKAVSDRIDQHLENLHPSAPVRAYTKWTNAFRHSALYPTPRWPIGVTLENSYRAIAHKISPLALNKWAGDVPLLGGFSPGVGNAITDELRRIVADPTISTAEKVTARQHLGGQGLGSMYGADLNAQLSRVMRDLTPEERTGFQQFQAATGPRQTLEAWEKYKHVIGHGLQQMETNARVAGVGKLAIEETRGFANKWRLMVNKQDDLVKEYARGILNPNKAVKFTEQLFDMYGNWNHLTPSARFMQKTVAPFGLWWLNSMKFVLKTLPKDHPMGSAALAALVAGTGSAGGVKGQKAYAQGNIPIRLPLMGAVELNPLHYSPFDIAREPIPKAVEMITPQARDLMLTALGVNTLTYAKNKAPEGVNAGRALEQVGLGVVPWARPTTEILREGAKANEESLNPIAGKGPKRGLGYSLSKYLFPIPATPGKKAEPTPTFVRPGKPKGFKSGGSVSGVKPKGFR